MDRQISQLDSEIQRLSEGQSMVSIVDEQGTRRWVKTSDTRYMPYLEGLKEKKKNLEFDREKLR
jgi:flagellar biosynthesis chaperone FliJ